MSQNSELDWSDVDADILLITNYFGGELSPREAADVEARVVHDDKFFVKVSVLIDVQLLYSPAVPRAMRDAVAERKAQVAEDRLALLVARNAWPDIDERLAEPMPAFVAQRKTGNSSVTAVEPRLDTSDGPRGWKRYTGSALRVGNRVAVAAALLSAAVVAFLYLKLPSIEAALEGKKLPARTSTWPFAMKVVKVAADAAPRVLALPRGVRATVMPGSQISFDTAAAKLGVSLLVRLDGEASFEVPGDAVHLWVTTPAAAINLWGGELAVRSAEGGYETLITLLRGRQARVKRNAPSEKWLDVTSGFVRVTRDQSPAFVTERTDKFPTISPR